MNTTCGYQQSITGKQNFKSSLHYHSQLTTSLEFIIDVDKVNKSNARLIDVVHVVFMACVLLYRHFEQNALVQRRQKVVKVDVLQTKAHFLSQVIGNVLTIFLFHRIKRILHRVLSSYCNQLHLKRVEKKCEYCSR